MDIPRERELIWGLELRYILALRLWATRQQTGGQLAAAREAQGFTVAGRPSKTISDALRWEIARGRVVRVGRGRYAAGRVTRQTRHRMRTRLREFRLYAESARIRAL